MKLFHIFKSVADSKNIPSVPFYIPYYLNKKNKYEQLIVAVQDNTKPFIKDNKVPIEHIPIKKEGNYFPSKKLLKKIFYCKPDVVIFYSHFGWPILLFLLPFCKLLNIKTIGVPDVGEWMLPSLHKSPLKSFIDFLRWPMLRLQITMLDKIVYQSEYQKFVLNKIKKIKEKKGATIPFCIPSMTIKSSPKQNYIFCINRDWSQDKYLDKIILNTEKILKETNFKLIVAGRISDNIYKERISRLIKNLELEQYVELMGFVSEETKISLFENAYIFYLPSTVESFGVPYIEAMAVGTPIVATKNSAVQYIVKDGGTGLLRNDDEEQIQALLELINNKNLYETMQNNCLKEAEQYTWEQMVKKWDILLKDI